VKLVSYDRSGRTRLGVVLPNHIVDLVTAAQKYAAATQDSVPLEAFADMAAFLSATNGVVATAQKVVEWIQEHDLDANTIELDSADITVPLARPGKIICAGLNYADHCREQGVDLPESPVLFSKFTTSLLPHGGQITWSPEITQQVDFEAELAVIIGREARYVKEAAAMDYVAAYTIINDVSARDVQFADGQWIRGKSFDTFCPIGPYAVTAAAIADPHDLAIKCRVNGQTMQDSNTGEMIFKIPYLIEYISHFCTLQPGDIISTGTPHGVGVFRDPQVFLKPGDVVEVEVEKIGVLRNTVS
jgi:acylpyruvate hydrolase